MLSCCMYRKFEDLQEASMVTVEELEEFIRSYTYVNAVLF